MPKAIEIITGAYRLAGVVGHGREPAAEQAAEGLLRLNRLIGTLALKGLVTLRLVRTTATLVPSSDTLTIGPTGDVVTASRPIGIGSYAAVIPVGMTQEEPIEVLTPDRWARQLNKAETSTYPYRVYYDPTPTNGTLRFHPVPTTAATLVVYPKLPLQRFADLADTDYELADGYERMLVAKLAIEFPELGAVPEGVLIMASEAMADVQRANVDMTELTIPIGVPGVYRGTYDVFSGGLR